VSETCAICFCEISLLPKRDKPVRHAGKVYCGECARMILDPDTDRGAEEIELPDPQLEEWIDQIPDAKKTVVSTPKRAEIEVVEEFSIRAAAPQKERKLDDDDWLKQANTKPGVVGGAAVAVREKKGGTSISKRANSPKPSGRMAAVKPAAPSKPASVRNIPAAPKGVAAPAEPEEEVELQSEPPARRSSRRMEKASSRPSGRLGKPAASSRMKVAPVKPSKPVEAPPDLGEIPLEADGDELAPVEPEPKQSESKRGIAVGSPRNSSRRMNAAKRGAAPASSKSARNDKSERGEREERGGRGKGRGDNMNMMLIGAGVVGIVLLVICVAAFGGGGGKKETKKQVPTEVIGQSSSELARHAAELEARGDKQGAADYYTRAAEACTNNEQAQQYNMHAYQIRKFTTLDMHH
jgi:hypothetical protein